MLVREWHAWWAALPALEAREALAAYRVNVVSDTNWKLDRELVLTEWRDAAAEASHWRVVKAARGFARGDVRGEIVALFSWMKQKFTGGDRDRTSGGFAEQ